MQSNPCIHGYNRRLNHLLEINGLSDSLTKTL
jgi:hypothetical protein